MIPIKDRVFSDANQQQVPYDGSPVEWRVSAYALVIKDNKLLTVKSKLETLRDVPGGGIELGETIEEAIARECQEEAGAQVKLGSIVWVNQDWFRHRNGTFFQAVQLFYRAELVGELQTVTDSNMAPAVWVELDSIETVPLPTFVKAAVAAL